MESTLLTFLWTAFTWLRSHTHPLLIAWLKWIFAASETGILLLFDLCLSVVDVHVVPSSESLLWLSNMEHSELAVWATAGKQLMGMVVQIDLERFPDDRMRAELGSIPRL